MVSYVSNSDFEVNNNNENNSAIVSIDCDDDEIQSGYSPEPSYTVCQIPLDFELRKCIKSIYSRKTDAVFDCLRYISN